MTEKRRQRSEELLQIKQKEKRKKEIKKLFSNYCKRMDNFIQSLCKKPIIIKDPNAPEDSRHPKNKSASSNNKNNFIFTRFMTDKKRIALLDERKKDVKDYEHKIMQSKNVQEKKMMQKILKDNHILRKTPPWGSLCRGIFWRCRGCRRAYSKHNPRRCNFCGLRIPTAKRMLK